MDDYIKSIKAQLYDRAVSPLFGTFALSWAAWNYKFIVLLVSTMEVEKKLSYIPSVLYTSWGDRLGTGLIFPAITTFAFIYGYPHVAKPVYRYVRQKQKELREIKHAIEESNWPSG